MPFPSIYPTKHCEERMGQRGISPWEITSALGINWHGRSDGVVEFGEGCPTVPTVTPGMPIPISRSRTTEGNPASLVLGMTSTGRLLHLVIASGRSAFQIEVITVWDPTVGELSEFWNPPYLVPTKLGARSLPHGNWLWGNPFGPCTGHPRDANFQRRGFVNNSRPAGPCVTIGSTRERVH